MGEIRQMRNPEEQAEKLLAAATKHTHDRVQAMG
jgi:hypothetical protein